MLPYRGSPGTVTQLRPTCRRHMASASGISVLVICSLVTGASNRLGSFQFTSSSHVVLHSSSSSSPLPQHALIAVQVNR